MVARLVDDVDKTAQTCQRMSLLELPNPVNTTVRLIKYIIATGQGWLAVTDQMQIAG